MKIMNENKKDFMEQLNDLDEEAVSEISENFPALDDNEKKRILKQCLQKSGIPDDDIEIIEETESFDDDDEVSVSGIERYDTPVWRKYASSAAALVVAVVGIASVIVLHGNMNRNDEFEMSDPPVLSSSYEESQITKIVSGSYIDNGYNSNGFDYANQNDYQGIVVGSTTTTTITSETTVNSVVNDVPEPDNNDYDDVPVQNEQPDTPQVTSPPATNPPTTNSPVTTLPVTTTLSVVTEFQTTTALSATEPTESTSDEVQKTFLEGRYFIVADNGKFDGFEFYPDGTIKQFLLNVPDGFKRYSDVVYGYEIIGNQFSYGTIGDEINWTVGTIINPNDGTQFSVQFPDGIYTFSTDKIILEKLVSNQIILNGVWYGNSAGGLRRLEFYDDMRGNMTYIESGTGIGFSYIIDGNENYVIFKIGSEDNTVTGTLDSYHEGSDMVITWQDGTIESLYSEQRWLEMNQ